MHESQLARQVLEAVLERARNEHAARVSRVCGWIAETEALRPDALEFHFRAHAQGTEAETARLELRLEHVHARCNACGTTYLPEHHVTLCPKCDATDAQLLGRVGLGIDSIEVE